MLRINEKRFLADLRELSLIGATAAGGVSRPALTAADIEARQWYRGKIVAAGLDYSVDGAGNQSAILCSDPPSDKRILAGSHLDSVPDGGTYDGALGLLAAFEALRALKDHGLQPKVTLEAVNCTDEEGAIMGLMGSRALVGQLEAADLERTKLSPAELTARLGAASLTRESLLGARRDDVLAWLELHIEQGTRLEEAGIDIGVVDAIVGIRSLRVSLYGEAAHAGTKPMRQRQDALWGAAAFALRARQHVMDNYSPGVCNIGMIDAKPGAFNIVPGQVDLALEFRHGSAEEMAVMAEDLLGLLDQCAREFGLRSSFEETPAVQPARMSDMVMRAIERGAAALGLSHRRMLSFAGHDTQSLARVCPAAMFFVPSARGISHNPREFTSAADCVNGANLMLRTLIELGGLSGLSGLE